MADNFNLRSFLSENKLTKNAKLLNEARVEGFDENKKAFEVSFVDKYGGGDFRILNAETEEQAKEVFLNIFKNNPDMVKSIRSIKPYQVPAKKAPQAKTILNVNYDSIKIDGVDMDDYPDFSDAYITYAEFEDGTPLTQQEIEKFEEENYGIVNDLAHDSLNEAKKIKPVKENTMTKREQYLTRLVENALGVTPPPPPDLNELQEPVYEDDNVDYTMGRHDDPDQLPNPPAQLNIPEGDEMAQETVIPEYKTIEELMKNIDHGTNKVAEEHKMQEMKKIAEALRMKAKKMEESEHAQHINPKDLKQLAKDAAALEKAAEKLKAAFDKKFNKKEKAPAAKAEKVEALQEGTFDLKKFLVENKLTTNSRIQE